MKRVAQVLSALALLGILVPPALFFANQITLPAVHRWMLVATGVWFVTAPLWMNRARD